MIIEIALGIVLSVILLALLPFILAMAWFVFMFALGAGFLALLGWGGYELYQMLVHVPDAAGWAAALAMQTF